MGIRFFCPNGHKLNVKEFQAGRRGICPFCGARIQIPTKSTRPASKSVGQRTGAQAATQTMEQDEAESTQISDSSPEILPGEPPSLPGDPVGGKMLGPSTPLGNSATSSSVVAPPTRGAGGQIASATPSTVAPKVVHNVESTPIQQPSASPAPGPVRPVPAAPVAAQLANPAASTGPALPVAASAPSTPAVPAALGVPAPPAATGQPPAQESADPIAEAPEMIWYVRPPSGGQFGPAAGELMRTWLSEGRVSADSLVWREGWRDWQEAGKVFPKLRANQVMDFLETASVVPVAATAISHVHHTKAKRSSDRNQITLLVALSLAVVVLLFVFLWVLLKQ